MRDHKRKDHGPWRYEEETDHLVYRELNYGVPVRELRQYADLQDWLCHLEEKDWVTPEVLGWLVKAMVNLGAVRYFSGQRR